MDKIKMIEMLERHISEHRERISQLSAEREGCSDEIKSFLDEETVNLSLMIKSKESMIRDLKKES